MARRGNQRRHQPRPLPRHQQRNPPDPPVRKRRRRGVPWFYILGLALLLVLAWAALQDYSTHGNIVPGRAVGSLLSPLSGLPDAIASGDDARSVASPTSSEQASPRPRPVPTPTKRPSPTPSLSAQDRELLIGRMVHVLVNEVRASKGVPTLDYDVALAQIARNHSLDMVARDYYSHDNPDSEGPSERASRQGYHCRRDFGYAYSIGVAENIFHGYGLAYATMPPAEVALVAMKSWMGSSGHRANILDRDYTKEGVGVAVVGRTVYFTQNFC